LKREFYFFRCPACNYLWVEPFLGYSIYNEDYYHGRGPDPYVDYASEYNEYRSTPRLLEYEDFWRLAGEHFRPVAAARSLRWLDYGCGSGGLLKFLRNQKKLLAGGREIPIELSGYDVGSYADRLKSVDRFVIHSREELEEAGQFDIISCIEVVEHVREVQDIFGQLARLLRPGGLLLLTTGNLTAPAARLAGLHHHYLLPELHISLFNPRCLAALYRRHGLVPLSVHYRGAVQFKILKSMRNPLLKAVGRVTLALPGVTRAIDRFYGVSAMPCAMKPLP
jgi:SAM-dependent methyltransferase